MSLTIYKNLAPNCVRVIGQQSFYSFRLETIIDDETNAREGGSGIVGVYKDSVVGKELAVWIPVASFLYCQQLDVVVMHKSYYL